MVTDKEASRKRRAVFLDRDGVLVVPEFRDGRSYAPKRMEDFRVYAHAVHCLDRLKSFGFDLVVVTNQPDVGHGLVAESVILEMHAELRRVFAFDDIKVCYHRREDHCTCRKPQPGLLYDAARERDIDLAASYMVGDRGSDVAAGRAAGCRTAFIDLGYVDEPPPPRADFVGADLADVTRWIELAEGHDGRD